MREISQLNDELLRLAISLDDNREVSISHIFFHTVGSDHAFTCSGSPPKEEDEEALMECLQFFLIFFELEEWDALQVLHLDSIP